MKKVSLFVVMNMLALPMAANAAGTYYTGAYQSPQTAYNNVGYSNYKTGGSSYSGYSGASSYARAPATTRYTTSGAGYSNQYQQNTKNAQVVNSAAKTTSGANEGFWLNGGLSRKSSMWQFDMKSAGSSLHYDNVDWNVLDVSAGYGFNAGNTPIQITAGLEYGMQAGESTMVDDDVSNGGYLVTTWVDKDGTFLGDQVGHVLSIGTSQGGSMLGFNVGVGLTDFFTIGNVKLTPSVGYRMLDYSLTTENNHGLSVDTLACYETDQGETQCDPVLIFVDSAGNPSVVQREDTDGDGDLDSYVGVPYGSIGVNTGGTYYFQQPGVSHSYDVSWSGPYLAMDMNYMINQHNSVNGRVELGFPGYSAVGDQPYRIDWQHPKSVEDSSGFGSAIHLGLGANWLTAITDSVSLSVGLTYDYYSVGDADAKTYLNMDYYDDIYNKILADWEDKKLTEEDMLDPDTGDGTAINIKNLESQCPGGVCSSAGEIESFFKSMGIRVGLKAKF